MMRRWRQFVQLTPGQRYCFLLASLMVPWTLWRLRVMGYDRLRMRLEALPRREVRPSDVRELKQMGEAVNIAARHSPLTCTCLPRSLILHELLRRRGHDSHLRIGARPAPDGIDAHAWVEVGGCPINDRDDIARDFLPFEPDSVRTNDCAS